MLSTLKSIVVGNAFRTNETYDPHQLTLLSPLIHIHRNNPNCSVLACVRDGRIR